MGLKQLSFKDAIRQYLRINTAMAVRNRAMKLTVELIQKTEGEYYFSCKGNSIFPYKIVVSIGQDMHIQTSCTCPFELAGLCKHEAASLMHIINMNETDQQATALFEIAPSVVKHDEIFLEKHIISEFLINKLSSGRHLSFFDYYADITNFDGKLIETTHTDWPRPKQKYAYNPANNILKVHCTCDDFNKKFCKHASAGLLKIVLNYGDDVFSPEFFNRQIDEYLSPFGLKHTDDYQAYFEFSIGTYGLQVIEKVKNLIPSVAFACETLLPELNEKEADAFYLTKSPSSINYPYGIGFCFELYKQRGVTFADLIPFKSKYKKNQRELSGTFKEIEPYEFLGSVHKDIDPADKQLVMQAFDFIHAQNHLNDNFATKNYRTAFISFQEFISQVQASLLCTKKVSERLSGNNITPLQYVEDEHPELYFSLVEDDEFFILKPKIKLLDKSYSITSKSILLTPFFCIFENAMYRYNLPNMFLYINRFQNFKELRFIKQNYQQLYNQFLKPLAVHFIIEEKLKIKHEKLQPDTTSLKKQVYVTDHEGEYVLFKLVVAYDEKMIFVHSKEKLYHEESGKIIQRDTQFENDFLEEFKTLHPDFAEQDSLFFLTPFQLIEDDWLIKASEKLEQHGISIFGAKELKTFRYNLNKPTVVTSVGHGKDWFDIHIEISYGKQKATLNDIKKALLRKEKFVTLNDGTLGLLPQDWLKKFETYFKVGETHKDSLKFSNYQFNIVDELQEQLEEPPAFLQDLYRKKQQLQNLHLVEKISLPNQLNATLRPYQHEGLRWLAFLHENNLGGCLADDMGLGKTLQVIAFMAYLKFIKKEKHTHLVVAPTSLMFNWQSEVLKFCPSLKTYLHTGLNREVSSKEFIEADIVLTTYGTVLRDIDLLKDIQFGYIVLDESQAIKNINAKRYKAVRMLKGKNRLALTGTPIENNTFDLFAQMNFLNPGILGSMRHFKIEFSDAIDKDNNQQAAELLRKMVYPFLLRRTKEHVAAELPEKSESILYCEMGAEQKAVYDYFKAKYRDYVLEKIDENGVEKSQMYVLEGLTKLRQICNSPELLNDEGDYGKSSVKLDILIDHLKSKTANHKVLVFSQFTSMLHLVKNRLDNENISYEYLDGKTKKREERVANFQNKEETRVFLISLKAGGVGLNLTAADYVYLLDPWWNPAVESQAIDRSHRIGQTNHVIAYKMICKDTIEEKIIDLQKSKKSVSEAVIQVDGVNKSFNLEDIKQLFG